MSKSFKFELNRSGVRELMRSDDMVSVLKGYASEVAGRLDVESDVFIGTNRANVSVEVKSSGDDDDTRLLQAVSS